MILVAGATGVLGQAVCRRLVERGGTVFGMVREASDPAAVAVLEAMGVTPVEAELADRESLAEACSGCDAVVSSITAMGRQDDADAIERVDRDGQIALVGAAADEGVERFVYISYSGAIGKDDPLTLAKRAVERTLKHSGMTWTVLRPSYFMESWLGTPPGTNTASGTLIIYGDGTKPISWISLEDVAEFAAAAVDSEEARNATLELGGPEALSPLEAAAVIERVTGRRMLVEHVSEQALRAELAAARSARQRSFAALKLAYLRGNAIPMDDMAERFGVELTPLAAWAAAAREDAA